MQQIIALKQKILAHDKFEDAFHTYLDRIIAWHAALGILNNVISNIGMHIFLFIFYLHYTSDPSQPESKCSFTNLLALCEQRKICGSRMLRTILGVYLVTGLVRTRTEDTDRRVRLFEPSPRAVKDFRRYWSDTLASLDVMFETRAYSDYALNDPSSVEAVMNTMMRESITRNILLIEQFEDLHALFDLKCGCPVIFLIVKALLAGQELPPLREIAKTYRISLGQVRNIVEQAKARGVLVTTDGRVTDFSRLVAPMREMLATELALYGVYTLDLAKRFEEVDCPA